MRSKKQQTIAKIKREQMVKERRARKQEEKQEAARARDAETGNPGSSTP
jgi:hypothetical protein